MIMKIEFTRDGDKLTAAISGRIDTNSAPEAEEQILNQLDGVKKLVLDFKEVDYISSAGLRILLLLHKQMLAEEGLTIININETVREVLEITGFLDILNVEENTVEES